MFSVSHHSDFISEEYFENNLFREHGSTAFSLEPFYWDHNSSEPIQTTKNGMFREHVPAGTACTKNKCERPAWLVNVAVGYTYKIWWITYLKKKNDESHPTPSFQYFLNLRLDRKVSSTFINWKLMAEIWPKVGRFCVAICENMTLDRWICNDLVYVSGFWKVNMIYGWALYSYLWPNQSREDYWFANLLCSEISAILKWQIYTNQKKNYFTC